MSRQKVECGGINLHLPIDYFNTEIDTYINLAKVKTHMETDVSFCLKNQMGLPSAIDRVMIHKTNLNLIIAELAKHLRPNLCLLEAYPAMENNGPHHGTAIDLNFVAGGDDMVELDSFVSRLLGYNPDNIKHIVNAERILVGKMFSKGKLDNYKNYIYKSFKQAKKVYNFGRKIRVYPTYSCSRCITVVNQAGREFKKHPIKYWRILYKALFSRSIINLVFGRADQHNGIELNEGDKIICIGNCAKRFSEENGIDCLDKCPPGISEAREYIVKKII